MVFGDLKFFCENSSNQCFEASQIWKKSAIHDTAPRAAPSDFLFSPRYIYCSVICAQQSSLVTEMESLACRKRPLLVISVQVTGVLLHFLFIFEFAFLCFSAAYCVVD